MYSLGWEREKVRVYNKIVPLQNELCGLLVADRHKPARAGISN
jgi:hypothetical protein